MIFIILVFYIYKTLFPKKLTLETRGNLPKICVYINSNNYKEILKMLSLQTYPNSLFDVYIDFDETFEYKFNVYKYNHDQIRNFDYNLITVINDIVDLNYLNYTAKEYMKGYDIIFGTSYYNTSLLLVKRTINKFVNNKIYCDCFSFNKEIFNTNIINFNNILILKKFLIKKSNSISFNSNIKTIGKTNTYNNNFFIINPLDKRLFYLKLYLFSLGIIVIYLSGNIILFLLTSYILLVISNLLFLKKYYKIKLIPVFILPINLIIYFISYLLFRINNKSRNIKTVKTT